MLVAFMQGKLAGFSIISHLQSTFVSLFPRVPHSEYLGVWSKKRKVILAGRVYNVYQLLESTTSFNFFPPTS